MLGPMGMLAGGVLGALSGPLMEMLGIGPTAEEKEKKRLEETGTMSAGIGAQNIAKFQKKVTKGEMDLVGTKGFAEKTGRELAASMSDVRRMEADTPERAKAEALLEKSAISAASQLGNSAKTQEEFNKGLAELTKEGPPDLQEAMVRAAKSARQLVVAQQALAKANMDTLKIMSTFNAAGNAVNNMLSSFETGSIALDRSIATMEAAQ